MTQKRRREDIKTRARSFYLSDSDDESFDPDAAGDSDQGGNPREE